MIQYEIDNMEPCGADPKKVKLRISLSKGTSHLYGYLKHMLRIVNLASDGQSIVFEHDEAVVILSDKEATIGKAKSREQGQEVLDSVINLLNVIEEFSANLNTVEISKIPQDPRLITGMLPQLDCGKCGYKSCIEFAVNLIKGKVYVEDCSPLLSPRFSQQMLKLENLFGS